MDDDIKPTADEAIIEELASTGEPSGVEADPYAPYPFEAEKISISEKRISLSNVARRLERKLIRAADIQRGDNLWDKGRQSRLIESLMLRIPLPLFYAAVDQDDILTIVDGLQRTGTIKRFLSDESFPLEGLEFLKIYEGKRFSELPEEMQIRIEETELNFVIINPDSPAEVQRNIFKRLNTGGLPLTDQEIRHALYYGPSTELLKRMADSQEFQQATDNSVNDSRMAARDLALRYLAFSMFGIDNYNKDDTMDAYLSDAMQSFNMLLGGRDIPAIERATGRWIQNPDQNSIEAGFFKAMARARELFDRCAFRITSPLSIESKRREYRSPINKSLFEVWSIGLACISDEQFALLKKRRNILFGRLDDIYLSSEESQERRSIGRDSAKVASVKKRHETIKGLIREITGDMQK